VYLSYQQCIKVDVAIRHLELGRQVLLRVLSFNTWGVPFFSRDRAARMRAIARAVAAMDVDVDVVGLQEVFYAKDRRLLVEAAAEAGLIYSHYFQSGVMGSGLLTLSRYPIVATSFLRFRLNGRPQDLVRVDYYAGKGVGRVRVMTPNGIADIYNAHLIAPYLEFGPDRFAAHRVAQAVEMGRYIDEQSSEVPAVLVGDMNCHPDDATYDAVVAAGSLIEACGEVGPAEADALFAQRNGYASIHPPDRFDYVFARSGTKQRLTSRGTRFVLGGMPVPNPDGLLGYSDHYGVLAEFELAPAIQSMRIGRTPAAPLRSVMEPSFNRGIYGNRKHRRKAGLVAAAASLSSAALVRGSRGRHFGPAGRLLTVALVAGLLVTGGVNLSTAARLGTESRTLTAMLGEES
jgi:endonuclease/exonuclease/phosphatase family metal-dependent hydrolase